MGGCEKGCSVEIHSGYLLKYSSVTRTHSEMVCVMNDDAHQGDDPPALKRGRIPKGYA
jgi:hypothetical protein